MPVFVIALWALLIGLVLLCLLNDRRQWLVELTIRGVLRAAVAVGKAVIFAFVLYGWTELLREFFHKP